MKLRPRILLAGALFLFGCHAAHDVAVGSYQVVTAPVRFVNRQIDRPPPTTEIASDVTTPGHPVNPTPSPAAKHPVVQERNSTASSSPNRGGESKLASNSNPPAPSRPQAGAQQFPTAKPVPDKPGYVYSLSDPGKYVDVTGYASGSKVKDPYSGKIFLVP